MPITAKGKCHQQTGGLTAGLKGMHAKRNDSDGYFRVAVAVEVSDVGPRAICKLIYFHFHFLSSRRCTFGGKMLNSALFFFKCWVFLLVPPSLTKLKDYGEAAEEEENGYFYSVELHKPFANIPLVAMFG